MIEAITVRDRGVTPRGLARQMRKAQAEAWEDTGLEFQRSYVAARFTVKHAREAGYEKRKGDELAWGSKQWRRSYMGIKWARRRHQNPLEFTGETYWATIKKSGSKLDANSNRAQLTFVGARKLSFCHPKSKIRMQDEFRRITPREARELAKFYDGALDRILAANNDQTTTTL